MNVQFKVILFCLLFPSFILMAKSSSSSQSLSAIHMGSKGPQGPQGPIGERGPTGPTGPQGLFSDFNPVYASLYVTYDPSVNRTIGYATGEKTVPFNFLGVHTDGIALDSTNRVSLTSGVYALSYQMMLSSSTSDPVITKIFLRLYPFSGSPIDRYTDWNHVRDPLDEAQPNIHGYFGDALIEIPKDSSYTAALIFNKEDSGQHQYDNPDVSTYPLTTEPCYPVKLTLEKIAEYKKP